MTTRGFLLCRGDEIAEIPVRRALTAALIPLAIALAALLAVAFAPSALLG